MSKGGYVRTADERVDVVWRPLVGSIQYPVVRVWTGIEFEDVADGAHLVRLDTGHGWAQDVATVLREGIRVAMDDARSEVA